MKNDITINEKKLRTGFIAQEVETAAQEIKYDFDGVNKPKNEKDNYSIVYADFVPSLVKAVQELSQKNESLQKQIDELKAMIMGSSEKQHTSSQATGSITLTDASLEQNIPNPFAGATKIHYTLPSKFSSAQIVITDKTGKTLKRADISGLGKGVLQIDAAALSAGAYNYSLFIDGRLINTKQMLLTK
jgi:hypothetical protein